MSTHGRERQLEHLESLSLISLTRLYLDVADEDDKDLVIEGMANHLDMRDWMIATIMGEEE